MTMTQASSDYFKQIAGNWDQVSAGYFGPDLRQKVISKAYLHPDMVVADIGGGTGFLSSGLAPLVKKVHLVDGSAEMVAVAQKNLSEFTNVEFHQADGGHLPFTDNSLDAVFANMYLHHTVDPKAAILEMVRVLRPGGRLMISDMNAHPYEWLKTEMADVWLGFNRDVIRNWFQEAGLVNLIIDSSGQSCCVQSDEVPGDMQTKADINIGVFIATGTRRMEMRSVVQGSYGEIARSNSSCGCQSSNTLEAKPHRTSCCAPSEGESSCCSQGNHTLELSPGYSTEDLSSVPQEAAEISLGCGNPGAFANIKKGETVLDIGSGGGLDVFLAAKEVGKHGRVIGVDMTPEMLKRAATSAIRMGISNVEFRQGFAEDLPVDDDSVDVVISNCVINLAEDKGQVFKEAFRVIKQGGRLEVSDMVLGAGILIDDRQDAIGWADCVTSALPEQEYLDLIAQSGFEDIEVQRTDSMGDIDGVPVYSISVEAYKPLNQNCGCGCKN